VTVPVKSRVVSRKGSLPKNIVGAT
jgi:hypothetical protein